jgi:hypothetical protein
MKERVALWVAGSSSEGRLSASTVLLELLRDIIFKKKRDVIQSIEKREGTGLPIEKMKMGGGGVRVEKGELQHVFKSQRDLASLILSTESGLLISECVASVADISASPKKRPCCICCV